MFNIFQLIHITILLKNSYSLYIIVVLFIILLIYFTSIIMIVMAFRIKHKKNNLNCFISILKIILPLFSFGFYGQIFLLFTTIFYCKKQESTVSPYLLCRPGHWFNSIKPIGGIAMFLHFVIAFITNSLYYKPIFIHCNTDLLKKSNSLPDVILLFTKMIIITIFISDRGFESEHWAILSFLVLVTGTNAYFTISYKNRQNKILLTLNIFFSSILFSGFLILSIGKMFKSWKFDGTIFLFFSSTLIIIIYILLFKRNILNFISKDYRNINNPDEYIQYINNFYNIVINNNNFRNYSINLKTLISSIEENCEDQKCPLKIYLLNLEKGFECEYLLIEFCEKLFHYGIYKFKKNIFLINHYSIFLIQEMNNTKKALIILESIQEEFISLQINYNIYISRKIIENYSSPFINKNNSIFEYRKNTLEFKLYIKNFLLLYNEFLSLLLESKMQNISNFDKINNIGYQIIKLKKTIDDCFDKLIFIKHNNIEIIKLYSEFAENILKNEEKIQKCKKLKKLTYNNNFNQINEKDYSNFNIEFLKQNFNLKYLIISSKINNFGTIIDCSINLCNVFGYLKHEIIGSHINLFIPKIFQQMHDSVVIKKTEENKLNFLEGLTKNEIYTPNFIQKDIFCISKSKCLVPLNMKIYLVNTEEDELVYIAEIQQNIPLQYDLLRKVNNEISKYFILTDKNFVIQSFTPNCINDLNMHYEDINCNYNIINYIKNFRDDYLNAIKGPNLFKYSILKNSISSQNDSYKILDKKYNNEKITYNKKQEIKNDIFNKKYSKKCKIIWRVLDNSNLNLTKIEREDFSTSIIFGSSIIFGKSKIFNDDGINLFMETKKIILNNELMGYCFIFSKIFNYENKSNLNYRVIQGKSSSKNLRLIKTKKYQCTFKNMNNENNFNKIINNIKKKQKRKSLEKLVSNGGFIEEEKDFEINDSSGQNPINKTSKYFSTQDVPDINNYQDIIINEDFIPNSQINFEYNINNLCYHFSKNLNNKKKLNESLRKEATPKIKLFKELKLKLTKKESSSESFFNSNSDYESGSEKYNTSDSKSYNQSPPNSNSNSLKEKNNNIDVNKINENKIENTLIKKEIFQIKEEYETDDGNNKMKIGNIENNDLLNNYYKVDFNKSYYLYYDFSKDIIIEENIRNISKMEEIKINLKKNIYFIIGRDEIYPIFSLKEKKKNSNKENEEKETPKEKYVKNINNDNNDNEKKKNEKKINEEINNHKDEIPIKKLKILYLVTYIIMIICGVINLYYNIDYYKIIEEKFNLTHISCEITFSQVISIYYVRELTLLNFNISEIEGGEYNNIPAKDRESYINLIKSKLSELFINNQKHIKKLFSSKYKPSKHILESFSSIMFNIKLAENNNNIIESDVFTTLMQYNSAFYSLSFSSLTINQSHDDLINYIYNGFNNYRNSLNTLTSLYGSEYDYNKKMSKLFMTSLLTIIFLIFSAIYIFGILFFLSANKKRLSYIYIFYNINSDILKILIKECLNLINKLKSSDEKNFSEEEDLDLENSLEENANLLNIKSQKTKMSENYFNVEENNNSVYNINILFTICYAIILLIFYSYFIYSWLFFIKIINKIDENIQFSSMFHIFQVEIIDMFNIYREFLFDNERIILNMNTYDYLRKIEIEIYNSITESHTKTDNFIKNLIMNNEGLLSQLERHFCSYFVTDYFYSLEECKNKFGKFLENDFHILSNYFLEEIKIEKNIAKYLFENENIIGNLTNLNITDVINKFLIENENLNKTTIFRLNLFNNDTLHSNLNLLFINILLPHLQHNRYTIYSYITVDGENSHFIKLNMLYLSILSIMHFGVFIIIKILNSQIYKVKNILSIVPIWVLTSQSNIKLLHNILVDN